jgi:hypothetical protein
VIPVSIPRLARRAATAGAALALVALAGCARVAPSHRLPGGYRLVQKEQFQALYGPDGRILRLLQDRNHDGRAEAVIVYRPNGKPERGEIDTDEDGLVDRREYFRADGTLERVEVDTNHDGRVDRTEYPP